MDRELEIEISPSGMLALDPQPWDDPTNATQQTIVFAGQQMMATQKSDDEPDIYELHFLGLMVSGFLSMDEAKFSAPGFAREVLNQLSKLIKD